MSRERKSLRIELRARRRAIPATRRIAAAEALAAQMLALPFAPREGRVAGYWAMDGEIALHAWQLGLPATVEYCLPVLGNDQRLRFAPWRPGQPLVQNRYGIPEPDVDAGALLDARAMDMVVLPLVGFDPFGNRLGMGAGCYDRSLDFRRSSAAPPWLVGAAFSEQQIDALDAQSWDVGLDAICTDVGTHLVTGAAIA